MVERKEIQNNMEIVKLIKAECGAEIRLDHGWWISIDGQVQCPSPSTIATELAGISSTMSSLITAVRTSMLLI